MLKEQIINGINDKPMKSEANIGQETRSAGIAKRHAWHYPSTHGI